MVNFRASLAALVLAASLPSFSSTALANLPDYRIGDIVREDVIIPAPPSAAKTSTAAALQQNTTADVALVVRFNPNSPDEAEISLRAAVIMARYNFLRSFQEQLLGRKPTEADLGSPAYTRAVAEVSRNSAPNFPFDQLAPMWVSGQSEETLILTLAQPIRQAMANIIVDNRGSTALPPNKSLHLITVKNLAMPLGIRDLDGPGLIVSQSKTISLTQARQLVENSFPPTQPSLARFAATFLRANTQPDPAATALLEKRPRPQPATVLSAQSGQVIVRKGQIVDRQVFNALADLREKYPGGALEQPAPVPPPQRPATRPSASARPAEPTFVFTIPDWPLIAIVSSSLIGLAGLYWIMRARKKTTRRHRTTRQQPVQDDLVIVDDPVEPTWQKRTHLADARADRAQDALRSGVLTWMKDKFVSTLFRHRAELLAAQQKAQAEMEQLERRLEQLHAPLQQRIQAYEKRIAELEEKLASKGEENRHLIGAGIQLARQQLERSRFESN